MGRQAKSTADEGALLGDEVILAQEANGIGDLGNDLDDPDDLLATAREAEHLLNHEDQNE